MAKRVTLITKMPNADCKACHGMGSVHMTAHFFTGNSEFEVACWECYGMDVKVNFPHPPSTGN
jgi:DnaJ-class molecular chaperone